MIITYLGHACLLVEAAGARILIDPGEYSADLSRLGDLDAILITHQHADHVDRQRLPGLLAANPDARLVCDPESAALLRNQLPEGAEVTSFSEPDGTTIAARLEVRAVGQRHAFNHDRVPGCANTGYLLSADGEPTLLHPGDAYDGEPGRRVDVLALPLSAPWTAVRDTLDFVRRIAPSTAVPIHDALLSDTGRRLYLHHVSQFGGAGTAVRDLADGRPWQVA